jgi:hypothetical protein
LVLWEPNSSLNLAVQWNAIYPMKKRFLL